MFAFSAPGDSPPPLPRNTHGIVSDIRRDVVSEVKTMVSDIRHVLKNQEGAGGQHLSVSVTHRPSATEYRFTIPQTQNRSAILTTERPSALHLYLVSLVNYHLRHQGPSLDATS